MNDQELTVSYPSDIVVENGGLFSSRGRGSHPQRVLKSYELILVRRGNLRLKEGDRCFTLQPGETLVLFPGRLHRGILLRSGQLLGNGRNLRGGHVQHGGLGHHICMHDMSFGQV